MGVVRRKWLRRILLATGVVVLTVLATGWLMFQHIPSWYQPPAIAADDERVKNDWVGAMDRLQEALLQEKRPFEFSVTQDQINAWLAIRETIRNVFSSAGDWLPSALSDPFVQIESDGLRLAATYRSGGIRTVLSVRLEVTARTDALGVRLTDVAGGALSMPKSWLKEHLADLDRRFWPAGQRSRYQLGLYEVGSPPLPRLAGLFEGVKFPNAWIWANGRQPFRITAVRFEPGRLAATIEPLPR
jgi:hypothetical protein